MEVDIPPAFHEITASNVGQSNTGLGACINSILSKVLYSQLQRDVLKLKTQYNFLKVNGA